MTRSHNFLKLRSRVAWGILLFPLSFASAQIATRTTGELLATRQVTINGESGYAGLTLYSENRVTTANRGEAIISLGKNGRIELGAETDFTLLFATQEVGGDLQSGRIIVSVPTDISVRIKGVSYQLETEGDQPSTLRVEMDKNQLLVAVHQGTAKIIYAGKEVLVTNGEEVWADFSSWNWRRRESFNPSSTTFANDPMTKVAPWWNLISTCFAVSFRRIIASISLPLAYYDTSLTCREHDILRCYSNGGVKP